MASVSIIDCLQSGQHLKFRGDDDNCKVCGSGEPTRGERFIAEFEADAVTLYGLELLHHLPGVDLDHYLSEHEATLEVAMMVTINVTVEGEKEKRTLIVDDAPLFFNPTWDADTLIECVVRDFEIDEAEARARLQACGLLPDAPAGAEELKNKETLRPGDTGETITQAPPTDPQPDVRHTVPPQVRWHVAFRCADRQVILDQNKLFIAEAVDGAAELAAAAPELLDLVDDLLDDRQREKRIPEALALVERLRRKK
jgi:hypothetical protein